MQIHWHTTRKHRKRLSFELRVTILGHVQRGDNSTAYDRLLGTQQGAAAIKQLSQKRDGVLMGLIYGKIEATPLAEVAAKVKKLDLSLLELARVLEK